MFYSKTYYKAQILEMKKCDAKNKNEKEQWVTLTDGINK